MRTLLSIFSKENRLFTFGLTSIILYYLPYLILGENSYIRIHDNLDGEIIYRILLSQNPGEKIDQVMNGLPTFTMMSRHNVVVWIFKLFEPFTAYLLNDFFVRIIAFLGMYFLLKKKFLDNGPYSETIATGVAVCFALIPFYSIFSGLTVAGQPLVLFAFLNLTDQKPSLWNYLIIIIFTLYSSLVLSGVFILAGLGAFWLFLFIKDRSPKPHFLIALTLLTICYLAVEAELVGSYLFQKDFESHRNAQVFYQPEILRSIIKSVQFLSKTHYHSGSFYTVLVAPLAVLVFLFIRPRHKATLPVSIVILTIVGIYFAFPYIRFHFGEETKILKAFQWDRFYFLLPTLWMILFALTLFSLEKSKRWKKWIPVFIILQASIVIGGDIDYLNNYKTISGKASDQPNYRQFFASDLFAEIKTKIGEKAPNYRVVNVGIHPACALYNGFHTLDAYQTNYPMAYKNDFREIIEQELDRNKLISDNFDRWGNRCYTYSSELGLNSINSKNVTDSLMDFRFNTKKFKAMGGSHIISAVPIKCSARNNLQFVEKFENDSSFYRLYLYKVTKRKYPKLGKTNKIHNLSNP
ncbi:putative membrane protein YkoS [Fulvitalea axinellae]|uniref:Membrane protein YkoS n=1 Tax=Fulvitalea axinellae TaxID=1182444 RepID=A0AAU9CQK8_9BACT|nr:putative membrane protein YkoS [Fulvitalea axinellae]